MMIEKVMIQSGAKSLKNSGGVGPPPMMIEKLGAAELAMQRMRKERNCECR